MADILSPVSCYPTTFATKITQNNKLHFSISYESCRNKKTSIQHPGNNIIFWLFIDSEKNCSSGKMALVCLSC